MYNPFFPADMFLSSIAIFLIESEINILNDSANDPAVYNAIGTQSMHIESRLGVWTQCDLRLSDFSDSKFCPCMKKDVQRITKYLQRE